MVPAFLSGDGTHTAIDIDEATLRKWAAGYAAIPGAASLADKGSWRKHKKQMGKLGLPVFVAPRIFRRKQAVDRIRKLFARLINR
jgi:hypothetical protein